MVDVLSDKAKFTEDLDAYMLKVGKYVGKSPVMGYKELDLHQFFTKVIGHGGFEEVVKKVGTWAKIWKQLDNYDASVTDASFRLKRNYERCLLEYEQKRFPQHYESCKETIATIQKESQSIKAKPRTPLIRRKLNSSNSSPTLGRHSLAGADPSAPPSLSEIKLPMFLGDVTIESFGMIIPRAPYVSHKNLYPIGYASCREFNSMLDPKVMVRYTSVISDDGTKPQFVVTAADDLSNPIIAPSASRAWKAVYKRMHPDSSVRRISGSTMFGLSHPTVKKLILELPNSRESLSSLGSSSSRSKRKTKNADEDYDSSSSTGSYKAAKIDSSSSSEDIPSILRKQVVVRSHSMSSLDIEDDDTNDLEAAVRTDRKSVV